MCCDITAPLRGTRTTVDIQRGPNRDENRSKDPTSKNGSNQNYTRGSKNTEDAMFLRCAACDSRLDRRLIDTNIATTLDLTLYIVLLAPIIRLYCSVCPRQTRGDISSPRMQGTPLFCGSKTQLATAVAFRLCFANGAVSPWLIWSLRCFASLVGPFSVQARRSLLSGTRCPLLVFVLVLVHPRVSPCPYTITCRVDRLIYSNESSFSAVLAPGDAS